MSLLLVLVVGLPLVGAAGLLLLPRNTPDGVATGAGIVVSAVTLVSALLTLATEPWRSAGPDLEIDLPWVPSLGVRLHLVLDGISVPLVLLTAVLGLGSVLLVTYRPVPGPSTRSLVAALLAVEGGALATFTAADLVLFFVAFEVVLVPMWAIIRNWGDPHDEPGRRDAAARFVLYTALGSVVMLVGIVLVAVAAGTSDLLTLTAGHGGSLDRTTQVVAAALLVAGLSVKVPVWPLHTWLPAAHTAAPTAGSVLLAGVLLKMGSYGIVRVVVPVVPAGFATVAPVLAAFGVVGILWGGFVCLVERDLKRLVAFSSVAHMGFVALGIATGTPQGLQGALFANIAHGVITALLFVVAGGLKERSGGGSLTLIGPALRERRPRLGALLAIGCGAALGLPGLAGFWGELLAVYGAWQAPGSALGSAVVELPGRLFWRTLGVLGVIGTALAAAYLLRVLQNVWHGDADQFRPLDVSAGVERRAAAGSGVGAAASPVVATGPRAAGGGGGAAEPSVGGGAAGAHAVDDPTTDATWPELALGVPLAVLSVVLGLLPWLVLRTTEPSVQRLLELARGAV
jgi:NADH-quinone oxidoreductase subunit M